MIDQCYYQNVLYVVLKITIYEGATSKRLSSLGLKTSLSKVPLLGDTLL